MRVAPARASVLTVLVALSGAALPVHTQTAAPAYFGPPSVRLGVRQAGVYRVAKAALAQTSPDLARRALGEAALYCRGEPVPHLTLAADGPLGRAGDIVFWGEPSNSAFSALNAYWLAPGPPLQFVQVAGGAPQGEPPAHFPETIHIEQENSYVPPLPPDAEDHWFIGLVRYDQPQKVSVDLSGLTTPAAGLQATVRVALQGQSNPPPHPNHHTTLSVNGQTIKDEVWDGVERRVIEAQCEASLLKLAGNEIAVAAVRTEGLPFDNVLLDWVEIVYPRTFTATNGLLVFPGGAQGQAYRVTGLADADPLVLHILDDGSVRQIAAQAEGGIATFADPEGVAGGRFVVACGSALREPETMVADRPSALRRAENAADYLVVCHSSLLDAVQPLVEHRRAQGLRTLVADVQDVYDEFSFGLSDPQAIRDFVAHACEHYQRPAPSVLLLVGDASADYRQANPKSLPDMVPTHMGYTKDLGDTATDDWFADLADDDAVPELAVGRIPARTPQDVQAAIAKILAFEDAPAGSRRTALLVADNDEVLFQTACEGAAQALTGVGWQVQRLYIEPDGSNAAQVREQLVPALRKPLGLVVYVGHAFHRQWAHEGILKVEDLAALTNAQAPFVISLSCLDGWFCDPNNAHNLAESWLLQPGGGAVGYWSPTAMGYTAAHQALLKAFLEAALDPKVTTMGEAARLGKAGLVTRIPGSMGRELAIMQTFFGDPALRLDAWRGG